MANRMILNETSYFGWGSREVLIDEIKRRKFKRALVVTDETLLKVGVADNVISLLYYYGYITIKEVGFGNSVILGIPNYSIRDFWGKYFLKILNNFGVLIDNNSINDIFKELVLEGRVDKLSSFVELILKFLDNKFFMKVDEEFIKFLYYLLTPYN